MYVLFIYIYIHLMMNGMIAREEAMSKRAILQSDQEEGKRRSFGVVTCLPDSALPARDAGDRIKAMQARLAEIDHIMTEHGRGASRRRSCNETGITGHAGYRGPLNDHLRATLEMTRILAETVSSLEALVRDELATAFCMCHARRAFLMTTSSEPLHPTECTCRFQSPLIQERCLCKRPPSPIPIEEWTSDTSPWTEGFVRRNGKAFVDGQEPVPKPSVHCATLCVMIRSLAGEMRAATNGVRCFAAHDGTEGLAISVLPSLLCCPVIGAISCLLALPFRVASLATSERRTDAGDRALMPLVDKEEKMEEQPTEEALVRKLTALEDDIENIVATLRSWHHRDVPSEARMRHDALLLRKKKRNLYTPFFPPPSLSLLCRHR